MGVENTLKELDYYFPGMMDFEVLYVDEGITFSWGKLILWGWKVSYMKYKIGIHQKDDYLSIDTGKFTSAPLFAHNLKQLLSCKNLFFPFFFRFTVPVHILIIFYIK
jgi:hypothetical protein